MQKRLARSEVPVEETWNLSDIFPSAEAWESELKAVAALVSTVTQYKGRFKEGPKVLLECFEAQEALQKRLAKVSHTLRSTIRPTARHLPTRLWRAGHLRSRPPSAQRRHS
jgi:hypothetical protein